MPKKKAAANAVKPKYELTPQERTAIDKYLDRKAASLAPRLKVLNKKAATIAPDHPDEAVACALLMEALGTADQDFLNGLIGQLGNASSNGRQVDEQGLNFMLSVVKSIQPRDQLEAMLASQMAAVHAATMTFGRRLAHVENVLQQDSAERAFNKLARTFTTQMEALKRYRTGGEQKVTVQHVSISEGGQAIVGNVTQAATDTGPGKAASSAPALQHKQKPPMMMLGERAHLPVPLKRKSNK
jgi:hypothetical protein